MHPPQLPGDVGNRPSSERTGTHQQNRYCRGESATKEEQKKELSIFGKQQVDILPSKIELERN